MKTKKLLNSLIIFSLVIAQSCGLSVKSDSSCKSTLTKGFWSAESGGEPLISKYGNFIFKSDGSCQYCTMGGLNGNQINGTWELGDAVDVTKTMSYRKITVTMSQNIGMGNGTNFELQLYSGTKNYISFPSAGAQYFHFSDDSKPL
ncbi:MAG TPA: hypothetical protein VFJ43_13540 [Bacteroidia bacterium]|nr:hypothetical protein [Bacteroidia bacterium]